MGKRSSKNLQILVCLINIMHNIDNMVVLCKYERTTTQINLSFGIFVITVVLKGERKFRPKKKKGERK